MGENRHQVKRSFSGATLLLLYIFAVAKVVFVEFHHASHEHKTNFYCAVHSDYASQHPFSDRQCSHFDQSLEDCELCVAHISLFQLVSIQNSLDQKPGINFTNTFSLNHNYHTLGQSSINVRGPPYLL